MDYELWRCPTWSSPGVGIIRGWRVRPDAFCQDVCASRLAGAGRGSAEVRVVGAPLRLLVRRSRFVFECY